MLQRFADGRFANSVLSTLLGLHVVGCGVAPAPRPFEPSTAVNGAATPPATSSEGEVEQLSRSELPEADASPGETQSGFPGSLDDFIARIYPPNEFDTDAPTPQDPIGPSGEFEQAVVLTSGYAGTYSCRSFSVGVRVAGHWHLAANLGQACDRDLVGRSTEVRDLGFVESEGQTYLWVHYARMGGAGEEVQDDTITKVFEVGLGEVVETAHILLSRRTSRRVIDQDCYDEAIENGDGEYNAYSFCDMNESALDNWATRIRFRDGRLRVTALRGTPPSWLLGQHTIRELGALSSEYAEEMRSSSYQ